MNATIQDAIVDSFALIAISSMTGEQRVLLKKRVLVEGDIVEFCSAQKPSQAEWQIDPPAEFWQARVTGQTGRSNNVEWLYDGEEYSFTGVSKEILNQLVDRPHEMALNG